MTDRQRYVAITVGVCVAGVVYNAPSMTDWVARTLLLAVWGDVVSQAIIAAMVVVLGVTAVKLWPSRDNSPR
jgi:hypothetical protein